jgi:hypothetical protein
MCVTLLYILSFKTDVFYFTIYTVFQDWGVLLLAVKFVWQGNYSFKNEKCQMIWYLYGTPEKRFMTKWLYLHGAVYSVRDPHVTDV